MFYIFINSPLGQPKNINFLNIYTSPSTYPHMAWYTFRNIQIKPSFTKEAIAF